MPNKQQGKAIGRHRWKSYIPDLTVGKVQIKPIADVLRFDRALLGRISAHTLRGLIRDNKDFAQWLVSEFDGWSKLEKFIESAVCDEGNYEKDWKHVPITPSDLRAVVFRLFSANQRAGGSRISAYPLVEICAHEGAGLEAVYRPEKDIFYQSGQGYPRLPQADAVRLSGYHIKISDPYARKIKQATALIAESIDRVSANLSAAMAEQRISHEVNNVEDISSWCRDNIDKLMAGPGSHGRFISKVDFFLYPTATLREKVLKRSSIGKPEAAELRLALQRGEFCLAAFDISGGAAGVGVSDAVARHWGFESSKNLHVYADALLYEYERINQKEPSQVIVMPCEAEWQSLGSVEYLPLCNEFRERGYRCHLVTSETYQDQLSVSRAKICVKSVNGATVVLGEEESTLIVRRYTYLRGTDEHARGIIPLHPSGTTVLPSDESRIVASDCRVNMMILDHATRPMRASGDEGQRGGFQVIPSAFLKLGDQNAAYAAQGFLASCIDQWPEVKYLGGIAKPVDKILGAEAGSVPSAYPLPPVPTDLKTMDIMVKPLFDNLLAKGIDEIVVMPNILPLVVNQNHELLPKFEIRMISLSGANGAR